MADWLIQNLVEGTDQAVRRVPHAAVGAGTVGRGVWRRVTTSMQAIYYQPNRQRKAEADFASALVRAFPGASCLNEHYTVPPESLSHFVDRDRLIDWLARDTLLPRSKRLSSIQLLQDCPSQIKICPSPSGVSFDFVLVADACVHYVEFHENQHRELTVSRLTPVYSPTDDKILVPRFLQRLIRDVWRSLYFRPYTIVWQDWFSLNSDTFTLPDSHDLHEFAVEGKFRFDHFIHCDSTA